jgi:GT2 family glycosyltransferase
MNIKVSVIIPNHNGKALLKENLPILFSRLDESVFSKAYEVIIVDDGSTDDSVLFVRDRFPNIKLIPLDKNNGFACACNAGAKEAAGGIIYPRAGHRAF